MFELWSWWDFFTVIILVFALGMLVTGFMAVFFGTGKSRRLGGVLLALGLVMGIGYAFMAYTDTFLVQHSVDLSTVLVTTIQYVLAVAIGAILAGVVFLGAMIKS